MTPHRFRVIPAARPGGGIRVNLPFEPSVVWDDRDAFHVNGKIGGNPFRAELKRGSPWTVELGPAWCRNPGFEPGDEVDVELALEGPQSRTMGADAAAAFQAEPEAARFFDSMPSFYRNNVARAIASAKRPETRARRIAEAVARAKRRERDA